MNSIHQELTEIGLKEVYIIETYINKLIRDNKLNVTAKEIADNFGISVDTAIMIIAGAQKHTCSNMLQRDEYENEPSDVYELRPNSGEFSKE